MAIIRKQNTIIRKSNQQQNSPKPLGIIAGPEYRLCVKWEDDDKVISLKYWKIDKWCVSVPDRWYVEAWENVTVEWAGTASDPYIVSSSWGWGWVINCEWVITCVEEAENIVLQWNITVEWTSVFEWDVDFEWDNVNFTNTTINNVGVLQNYDSTSTTNHNGDTNNYDWGTINYDWSTINSSSTEYNHDWDEINYNNTNIEWGSYTNATLYNPTIVWGTWAEIFWYNEEPITWGPDPLTITLTNIPLGDVVLSTVGGLIAIEPSDYTHANNSNQVVMNMDTSWEDILVSYIVAQGSVNTALVNEVITGDASNTVFPLINEPLWDIMVSVKGGVIQIEPTDYTHTAGDDEFTMLIDTTWLDIIVTYLKDTTLQQLKQSDWNEIDNTKQSFIKNKPTIPVIPPIPTDVSDLTDTTNLLWGTITPAVVSSPTHNATVGEYVLVEHLANTTINLPPAQEGKQIRIKKFTGEDVFQVTINPNGSELIDGYTAVSMSINRTMYTFTGISGNRYLGD